MTTPLTDEEMRRYSQLVDAILATADLATVTRKKVRKGLEKALGGKDLSDQKYAIKDLIEARFDAINSQSQSPDPANGNGDVDVANGDEIKVSLEYDHDYDHNHSNNRSRPAVDDDDDEDHDGPAKKKHKRSSSSIEDADARLAAELQAQENRLARARTTRGGSTSKSTKPRKTGGSISKSKSKPKQKSAANVDDSDDEGGGDGAPKEKRKASGGFQKPFNLSYQLGDLVGESQLSRPQVVKRLWEHIKGNDLQDPQDKRQIRCDDKMQAVFKQQKIDMFQMNKLLSNHLYPVDEE